MGDKYLAATAVFKPGHFACKAVWNAHFVIHPRLKTGRSAFAKGDYATLKDVSF